VRGIYSATSRQAQHHPTDTSDTRPDYYPSASPLSTPLDFTVAEWNPHTNLMPRKALRDDLHTCMPFWHASGTDHNHGRPQSKSLISTRFSQGGETASMRGTFIRMRCGASCCDQSRPPTSSSPTKLLCPAQQPARHVRNLLSLLCVFSYRFTTPSYLYDLLIPFSQSITNVVGVS
jgi:hypothetical protein